LEERGRAQTKNGALLFSQGCFRTIGRKSKSLSRENNTGKTSQGSSVEDQSMESP